MDGELVYDNGLGTNVIGNTSSLVRSHNKIGPWTFFVFDNFLYPGNFARRLSQVTSQLELINDPRIRLVEHEIAHTASDVELTDERFVNEGWEGSILRDPDAAYDFGRCTPREATLIKLKRYHDEEAQIIGWKEKMHNANPIEIDTITGRKFRSSAGECDVGLGVVGSLNLRHRTSGLEFSCGSGIDDEMGQYLWSIRPLLESGTLWCTYKTMSYGSKERPRHPIFKRIRDDIDMETVQPQQGRLL